MAILSCIACAQASIADLGEQTSWARAVEVIGITDGSLLASNDYADAIDRIGDRRSDDPD